VTDSGGLFSKDTIQITVNAQLPQLGCDNNRPLINAQLIPVGNLSEAKRFGIAAISTGNKIFFAGGIISPNQPSSRIDIFDIASNSWSTAELSVPRFNISAITSGNKVFFAGGAYSDGGNEYYVYSTVDIYDLFTNTWSVASLSEPRELITVATVGSKVFFVGGSGVSTPSNKVDIYDLSANSWSTTQLSESKSGISAVTVGDKIYFAGGNSWVTGVNLSTSSRIDIYDNSTNSWSASFLSVPKADMGSIAVANNIYWAGGTTGTVTYSPPVNNVTLTCSVEIKNVNTFNSLIDHLFMPGRWMPISGQNAILKDNKIVFLRIGNNLVGDKFDIYDITTNTWSVGLLPVNIGDASFISANNTIYITGGSLNGVLSSQVWKLEF
jgi:N-acetylneuraminic acid mutarotase